MKLNKLDVTRINNHCDDTYSNPKKYDSYRRDFNLWVTGNQTHILSTLGSGKFLKCSVKSSLIIIIFCFQKNY